MSPCPEAPAPKRSHTPAVLGLVGLVGACTGGARYASGPSCEERQTQLVEVLQSLPDETLTSPLSTPLPSATLAGVFGTGPVLEVNGSTVLFDGAPVVGATLEVRAATLQSLLVTPSPSSALYVAASANVDVRTLQAYLAVVPKGYDVRLTFARPVAPSPAAAGDEEESDDAQFAERVLLERDPAQRRLVAMQGYEAYSDCEAVDQAARASAAASESQRWPALKRAMIEAVPRCPCSDIDPDGLRQLLAAEQRAGNVALGSMPAAFLGDPRCKASMPLRTVQQVLADVENFEAEFSGNWDDEGVRFEEVVTDERLLNYLCSPMPGELFESISGEFTTVYVQHTGAAGCHAYRIEPVARGAVFGTLRAVTEPGAPPSASYHYRLGGNDLRVYGPTLNEQSRPTDPGPWVCDRDLKLSDLDPSSISLESGGRIHLTRAACLSASPPATQVVGCTLDPTLAPTPPGPPPDVPAAAPPTP